MEFILVASVILLIYTIGQIIIVWMDNIKLVVFFIILAMILLSMIGYILKRMKKEKKKKDLL
ncbi:hypothetical protein, partial [Robertmurraya sp. Marseille-Q9965]